MNNKEKFGVTDNSGDRKYFAIIPYYIVNHSTAYEQSLYLVMKRIASENGTCFASPEYVSKKMRCAPNTVKKYRKKLIARGWIRKIGQIKSGRTSQLVDNFEIVDLWELNNDYVRKLGKPSPNDTFELSSNDAKASTGEKKVSPVAHEEETIKKNKKEELSFEELANAYKNGNGRRKPYYLGDPMRWKKNEARWYVIDKHGRWLLFADKEGKIEWK